MNCQETQLQFNEYSSLNSLLMSLLYSENSRDLIIKKAKTWDNSNKFKSIVKKIVNKNKQKKDISSEISLLKPDDIFIENMYFLKDKEKENLKNFIRNLKTLSINYISWIDDFIIDLYRCLGLSCLDIYYSENNIYLNLYKFMSWEQSNNGNYITKLNYFPFMNFDKENNVKEIQKNDYDVLVVFHEDLNKTINDKYIKKNFNTDKKKQTLSLFKNDNIEFKKFIEIKDEIEFNGNLYILDSILLKKGDKSIVGFICDGEKYVYNNFSSSFNNPCSIIKFDWKYNNGEFCYNPFKCDLNDDITNIDDLCFDFNDGDKTLIYIKKDIKPIIPDISDEDILKIIKEIKQMEISKLIIFIKKYDSTIILSNSMNKIELEKIALRLHIINYLQKEKQPEQTEEAEQLEEKPSS
jgi:hypothetical protein